MAVPSQPPATGQSCQSYNPPPKSFTVLVDTRERYPFLFPSSVVWYPYCTASLGYTVEIKTKREELSFGDYCLEGHEHVVCIEKKGSLSELTGNLLTKDRNRAVRAFQRLADAVQHPYLFLEMGMAELFPARPSDYEGNPELILDSLFDILHKLKIGCHLVGKPRSNPARRRVGTYAIHLLLNAVLRHSDKEKLTKSHKNFFDLPACLN